MTSLDLWLIGNCQVSALIDKTGRFVWACAPRVDGDPLFSTLLSGEAVEGAGFGFWSVELENGVSTRQRYRRNTPVLGLTLQGRAVRTLVGGRVVHPS